MWSAVKTTFRWIYDWITILAAALVGLPSLLLQFISFFDAVDISPYVGPDKALKIVTGVAITKALLAFIESRINKPKEPSDVDDNH